MAENVQDPVAGGSQPIRPRGSSSREGSMTQEDQDLLDARQAHQTMERAVELMEELSTIPRLSHNRSVRRELHRDAMAQVRLAVRFAEELIEREEDRK